MQKIIHILILALLLSSVFIQDPKTIATYKRQTKNAPQNGTIILKSNGTFLTQFFGGCDGMLESQGKWKINKDTLHFTDIENRMMNDPWKRSNADQKYLIKKQTLTYFWMENNKIHLDSTEYYKKVKNK
jgi:hypothetical protein